jgi:DNA repair exonuclease SbcCD ATPase subunit
MLKIKNITLKNFMSTGNVTQGVNLEDSKLTLVLGENLDMGGGGSRNGVGKSTLVQAICYALFGSALTNIKKDNLINKTNAKNMLVTIDFEKDGNFYRIERGRRPGIIRFIINDKKIEDSDDGVDEAHGEIRITQQEIDKVLGFSKEMFKQIIALNTFTEPFLNQGAAQQRMLIEELLGVTQLSKKAEILKEKIRETKERIVTEEISIKAILDTNSKIQQNIDTLKLKSSAWETAHTRKVRDLKKSIHELQHVDIQLEIEAHKSLVLFRELDSALKQLKKDKKSETISFDKASNRLKVLTRHFKNAIDHKCPTCGNELHDTQHEKILSDLEADINLEEKTILKSKQNIASIEEEITSIETGLEEIGAQPNVYYNTLDEAYNHRTTLETLLAQLTTEEETENPFDDQIDQLSKTGLQEISYDQLNTFSKKRDHQEFLHKLLTSKDSFIRKKIIDQNLAYLNVRLNHYLEKLGLPHEVRFLNDLSVEITELGREFDFDNLSRGERNRLIFGLSFAFRDVWESLNTSINLFFIDELIDSGFDQIGVENTLGVLKAMGRDRLKDVFLISHREELLSRVSKVMLVRKEGGFTTFSGDLEEIENLEI